VNRDASYCKKRTCVETPPIRGGRVPLGQVNGEPKRRLDENGQRKGNRSACAVIGGPIPSGTDPTIPMGIALERRSARPRRATPRACPRRASHSHADWEYVRVFAHMIRGPRVAPPRGPLHHSTLAPEDFQRKTFGPTQQGECSCLQREALARAAVMLSGRPRSASPRKDWRARRAE